MNKRFNPHNQTMRNIGPIKTIPNEIQDDVVNKFLNTKDLGNYSKTHRDGRNESKRLLTKRKPIYQGYIFRIQQLQESVNGRELTERLNIIIKYQNKYPSFNLNLSIKKLIFKESNLESLGNVLTNFPYLDFLKCSGNYLKKLDLSNNRFLRELNCSNNDLRKLDLSKNNNLERLNCSRNDLRKLDISNNNNLELLNCSWNSLELLDLSKNNFLVKLYCSSNALKRILYQSRKYRIFDIPPNMDKKTNWSSTNNVIERRRLPQHYDSDDESDRFELDYNLMFKQ